MQTENIQIKPNKISFILFSNPLVIFLVIILIFLNIIVGFIINTTWNIDTESSFIFISMFSIPIVALLLISIFWTYIVYKKEEYIITDRKIIYNYWNLFSDNSVEISLDRVVIVHSILWFVQHSLFKTWDLIIKTAWSSSSKINFSNISNTSDIYNALQSKMQKNWFHLQKDKLVQEARPHMLWIFWEIFSKLFGLIVIFFYGIIIGIEELNTSNLDYTWIIISIFIIILLAYIILTYLDLKRRRYDVYTDSVFYNEWFLTKRYSFIPMAVIPQA